MRPDIANLVYPVFGHALKLKDRLARGDDNTTVQKEQSILKGLLKSESEARRWSEFAGEITRTVAGGPSDGFLGIRYALVCWLDEIFILDSPWKSDWSELSLEVALYGTRDRSFKFWDQARRAEARPETDALEVFFLCVMLGFRGDLSDAPDRLKTWRDGTEAHLAQGQEREWPGPVEVQPAINVPPLTGTSRQQTALTVLGAALLLSIPAIMFYLVFQLQK